MRRLFGLSVPWALGMTVLALGLSSFARDIGLALAGGSVNGSESYFPAFALLGGSAIALALLRKPGAYRVALATGVFAASLTARTVDAGLCQMLPFGTHFLWHLLNGTMIGILLFTLVRAQRKA